MAGYWLRNCLPSEVEAIAEAMDATVLTAVERGGAGIRRMATVRDATFIRCMNYILPRFLTGNSGTNTPTPSFFDPQLGDADARVMEREAKAASGSQKELTAFLD
eukprot:jgi/Tetstr1/453774/TSEL_040726.t1